MYLCEAINVHTTHMELEDYFSHQIILLKHEGSRLLRVPTKDYEVLKYFTQTSKELSHLYVEHFAFSDTQSASPVSVHLPPLPPPS